MLSLLGSLIGFGGSALPQVIDVFKSKGDRKHEIDKMRVMAELKQQGMDFDMKMYDKMGADKEHERLIAHDTAIMQSTKISETSYHVCILWFVCNHRDHTTDECIRDGNVF